MEWQEGKKGRDEWREAGIRMPFISKVFYKKNLLVLNEEASFAHQI